MSYFTDTDRNKMNEASSISIYPPLQLNPPLKVTLIRDVPGLAQIGDFVNRTGTVFGWDVETDPKKDYFFRRCRTVQIGNVEEQLVVDLLGLCGDDPDKLFAEQGGYGQHISCLKPLLKALEPSLTNREYTKVGVNLAFEYLTFYWLFGMRTCGFFDCSVVERCIYAGLHSLKDYAFYGMEEMMGRYYNVSIDKTLQTSFTLDLPLTWPQVEYAALDTRNPLGLKKCQEIIISGKTSAQFTKVGLPKRILGDNLVEIVQIENDAVGVFQDMHVHGERIDTEKWLHNDAKARTALAAVIKDELDSVFLPVVGSKFDNITDEMIDAAEKTWKVLNNPTPEEIALRPLIRKAKQEGKFDLVTELKNKQLAIEDQRKIDKEPLKTYHGDLKKKRTAIKNLAAECEGEALLNYASGAQLKHQLEAMYPGIELESLEDECLEKLEGQYPILGSIRKYRKLSKEVGTYGEQWTMQWKTHPCKEEGWLHPGDGRLHCTFNQYDAETGRSSSEQPNAQNLPKDKAVRSCFIADPPNEDIRVSDCCQALAIEKMWCYVCSKCETVCTTSPMTYQLLTIDMSGAELRILAEEANETVWIDAFDKKQDVHSICTEMIEGPLWAKSALPNCAYYALNAEGEINKKKCKCPVHMEIRDWLKFANFGLPYGISEEGLAPQIKKSVEATRKLLRKHKDKFPKLWEYLDISGQRALDTLKAFDLFGRRRLFKDFRDPANQIAKAIAKDKERGVKLEKMKLDEVEQAKRLALFEQTIGRKPNDTERYELTHRAPNQKELNSALWSLRGSVERQGKNHPIQSCNSTIIKLAMGCGYDVEGRPYLWHTLGQYMARILKMVHDELVIHVPSIYAQDIADLVQDAFRRAAATKMKKVIMESDYHIESFWCK